MKLLRQLLPAPGISALLFCSWLMLNESVSAGNLLLAALLGVLIPSFSQRYRSDQMRIKSWGTVLSLTGVVLWDIVKSNIDVAKRVLGNEALMQPRFVWVPLDLRDPHAIVALAGIITLTPGTVSSELSEDRRHLLVHALHCEDPAALVQDIKSRYEQPLREIFE